MNLKIEGPYANNLALALNVTEVLCQEPRLKWKVLYLKPKLTSRRLLHEKPKYENRRVLHEKLKYENQRVLHEKPKYEN